MPLYEVTSHSTLLRRCHGCKREHIALGDKLYWHYESGSLIAVGCLTDERRAELLSMTADLDRARREDAEGQR